MSELPIGGRSTASARQPGEESYAFLIRPRRFGKSLWVSVLKNYYDRTRAEDWPSVFDGTDIGREPTEDELRYVILRFNFSAFDDTLETLRERFEGYCALVSATPWSATRTSFPAKRPDGFSRLPALTASWASCSPTPAATAFRCMC